MLSRSEFSLLLKSCLELLRALLGSESMSAHMQNLGAYSVSWGNLFYYKDLQVLSECGFPYHENKPSFRASTVRAFSKPKFSRPL